MINHTWNITQLDSFKELNGIQNVPYQAHYSVTTTNTEYVYKVIQNGSVMLPYELPELQVSYSTLTEIQILDIVKEQINIVPDYDTNGNIIGTHFEDRCLQVELEGERQLQEMIDPPRVTIDLPWKTPAQILEDKKREFTWHVQNFMDQQASLVGYDNLLSACSYAAVPNTFQAESQSFVLWRSSVWEYCYQEFQKIQEGTRSIPTIQEFIAELPNRTL